MRQRPPRMFSRLHGPGLVDVPGSERLGTVRLGTVYRWWICFGIVVLAAVTRMAVPGKKKTPEFACAFRLFIFLRRPIQRPDQSVGPRPVPPGLVAGGVSFRSPAGKSGDKVFALHRCQGENGLMKPDCPGRGCRIVRLIFGVDSYMGHRPTFRGGA